MTEYFINNTIDNMVKNLKPGTSSQKTNDMQYTPMKRSLSSSNSMESFEEATPVKKLKQENRFDLSYAGSPREMRRLRADLIEARNTILTLESQISKMHGVRKQMQLMFDNENSTLKRRHEHNLKSIEELENQLQTVRQRESDLKKQLAEVNNKYEMLKIKNGMETERFEKSMGEMKEEVRLIELEENSQVPSLQRKISELKTMLEAAEEDAIAQKKLAAELEKRLSEKSSLQKDLDLKDQALQQAKLHIKELGYAKESMVEFHDQAKSQSYKINHYVELLRENEVMKEENIRLKEEVRNKLLLEEEVYDLKNRLIKYKEQEKQLLDYQTKEIHNALIISEWTAVARGICESTESEAVLPHLLRNTVERLQQQELSLTAEKVDLEQHLKTSNHELKVVKNELEKNQKLLVEIKATSEQKQNLIHRMQKKLILVSRERDSYRLQLDSYEKDLTMCVNMSSVGTAQNQLLSQKERIDNLERIVEGYRDMVNKLENDLKACQPNIYTEMVPARAEQISRLQDEIQQLKNENEKLRDKKDELEVQLEHYLVGHDTLQGGAVFHLANNPLAECIAQREEMVDRLEKEVEKLKRKIKNLEEGIEISNVSDLSICPKEVQSLKDQIKTHEQQTQMLKDYFKSQMQEFRNVIYMLLGYKIDRQNSLYKLRSMYAEQPDDQLCFQLNKEGDLNLLENEFTSTLEDMINLHLKHQKSIPVFLSSITMDLFNNKTITKTFQIE